MRRPAVTNLIWLVTAFFLCSLFLPFLSKQPAASAYGGLNNRSDKIANSTTSAVTTHLISFDITVPSQPLGSIEMEFCANDPLPNTPCTIPTGLDLSGATLVNQSGNTGFNIDGSSTNNKIVLTRFAALPMAAASSYQFDNVINPSVEGSYYIRLRTFSSTDASGTDIEDGGVVFVIVPAININAVVPPYLRFCVGVTISGFDCTASSEYLIDLGDFSASKTTVASSEFVVATNAGLGYSITINGTTLTSGNNVIPPLATPTASSKGSSQFGLNLRANSSPGIGSDPSGPGVGSIATNYNQPNQFTYNDGDTITTSSGSTDNRKYTISYITNINASQPVGIYAATFSLICLANF